MKPMRGLFGEMILGFGIILNFFSGTPLFRCLFQRFSELFIRGIFSHSPFSISLCTIYDSSFSTFFFFCDEPPRIIAYIGGALRIKRQKCHILFVVSIRGVFEEMDIAVFNGGRGSETMKSNSTTSYLTKRSYLAKREVPL